MFNDITASTFRASASKWYEGTGLDAFAQNGCDSNGSGGT